MTAVSNVSLKYRRYKVFIGVPKKDAGLALHCLLSFFSPSGQMLNNWQRKKQMEWLDLENESSLLVESGSRKQISALNSSYFAYDSYKTSILSFSAIL